MLAINGLGAAEAQWSMTTGSCSGGQFNTYCRNWSGSAGAAYNCIGCSSVEREQIAMMQSLLINLIQALGLQNQFGAGLGVSMDKVIGLNTTRAVGILGMALAQKDIVSEDTDVVFAISGAYDVRAALAAKSVGNTDAQRAIQAVAKNVPGLIAFFQQAQMQLVTPDTPPVIPTPPGPTPPTPTTPPPIVDFGRRRKVMLGGGIFLLATSVGIFLAAASKSGKRRRK